MPIDLLPSESNIGRIVRAVIDLNANVWSMLKNIATNTANIASNTSAITALQTPNYGLVNSGGALGVSLSKITASLGADVTINTGSYFDGPSIAQGTSGTWFVSGTVTVTPGAATPRTFNAKLWDGTTVIDSGALSLTNGFSGIISLSGYIASPAGNLKISVQQANSDGVIKFNQSGNSKDSTISAIRIA